VHRVDALRTAATSSLTTFGKRLLPDFQHKDDDC
jgi:hypothetical protein